MVFIILHWLSIFLLLFNLSGVGISDSQNILQLELVQFGLICFMASIGRRYGFSAFY